MMVRVLTVFFLLCFLSLPASPNADLVIFSYDRPMQLFAYLESLQKHVTGLNKTFVLYRTSADVFDKGYQEVKATFPSVVFFQQTRQSSGDFKPILLHLCFKASTACYLLFAVDDIIVTRDIDLAACMQALEETKYYGFYLRLGKNIKTHYGLAPGQTVLQPALKEIKPHVFSWDFSGADFFNPWHYPHSVDMTLFKKTTIEAAFRELSYVSPNTLEQAWAHRIQVSPGTKGLCFGASCMVNLPLNLVQEYPDKHMNFASTAVLLELFEQGLKIDVAQFLNYENTSPHEDLVPTFISRKQP